MNNLVALAIGAPGTARTGSTAINELPPTKTPARARRGSVNQ